MKKLLMMMFFLTLPIVAAAQFAIPGHTATASSSSATSYTESNATSDLSVSSACNSISTRALGPQQMVQSSPASGPVSVTIPATTTENIVFYSPSGSPNSTSWPAGNWLIALDVVTTNVNLTWTQTCIERASSTGTGLHLTGSLTGQSIGLGTAQSNSMIVSGSSETAGATDRIEIIISIANSAATSQTFSYSTAGASDTVITPFTAGGGGGTPTLCAEMQHVAYYPSGYSFFDSVIGRSTNTIEYIAFVPSKTGNITSVKWYNSAGSHGVWDSCTANYGSIEPCANHGGQPQYENVQDPSYPLTFPSGWWPWANTCSSTYSGCYSGGTGGIISLTLENSSGTTLATATINHPNETYGFYSTFPVVNWSTPAAVTSGSTYYVKIADTDSNQSANWFSFDNYTPYNLFTAAQSNGVNYALATIGGKANVDNVLMEDTFAGAANTNFQPIIAFGFDDGTCASQGFAP